MTETRAICYNIRYIISLLRNWVFGREEADTLMFEMRWYT